ncbi:MAG TPA: HAMP domain-containing sensor histidine kinase, partial [Longimicrobium sp.]|nr:HAMP domain-containing sensor histidine kinase [Longimicrobium sp.]
PLNSILILGQQLADNAAGNLSNKQVEFARNIHSAGSDLLMLINDILSFARLEAGSMQFDVHPLAAHEVLASVESLVAPQAEARGVAYTWEPCDPSLRLLGDAERVRQVLLNLVGNAIKFTRAGGWVLLSCAADEGWVELRVRDNGVGIPPEEHERIFDPFQQVGRRLSQPQEGVGLGLAISRDLARGMSGDLTVQSTPGEGSVFTLRLPRAGS